MNRPRILACLWILFLVRGLFYISFVPLWEGFDEWAHYAVIQNLAAGGRALINRGDRVSREVQASLELAPTAWKLSGVDTAIKYDAWWQLPGAGRTAREQELRSLPARWARESAIGDAPAYEAQQTPLYYWLFALFYKLIAGVPFLTRVWLLRFLSLLAASAVIPLSFWTARMIFGDDLRSFGVTALIAAMPQLMMIVSSIGNHGMAVALGGLLLFLLFRWKAEPQCMRRALAFGSVLGLALLTKAYFIALVPPVFVFAVIWAKRKAAWRQALVSLALAFAIAAWWYVRNWLLTRSIAGDQLEVIGGNTPKLTLSGAMLAMNWWRALDFTFLSHIWLGDWSFLVVRSWMYHLLAVAAGMAAIGLMIRLFRQRKQTDLLLLSAIFLTFLVALGYQAARDFQTEGFPGAPGYYLLSIVVAEAILLIAGLQTIAPVRVVIPAAVISFAALEFFGVHFYAMPYYAGFIAHLPNGNLPALKLHQLQDGGLHTLFTRLATNKPEFLSAPVIMTLWLLFLAATIGLMIVALRSCFTVDPLQSSE